MAQQSDNLDHATDIEIAFREKAIADIRRAVRVPDEFDGTHCTECSSSIPAGRLALGKFTCVGCQEYIERNSRLYGRR